MMLGRRSFPIGNLEPKNWSFVNVFPISSGLFSGSMLIFSGVSTPFLGGGNSNIFYFHPEHWGNDPFWLIFFRWVETTNSFSNDPFSHSLKKKREVLNLIGRTLWSLRWSEQVWEMEKVYTLENSHGSRWHLSRAFFSWEDPKEILEWQTCFDSNFFIILYTQSLKRGDTPLLPSQWLLIEPFFVTSKGAHIKIWSSFLLAS